MTVPLTVSEVELFELFQFIVSRDGNKLNQFVCVCVWSLVIVSVIFIRGYPTHDESQWIAHLVWTHALGVDGAKRCVCLCVRCSLCTLNDYQYRLYFFNSVICVA